MPKLKLIQLIQLALHNDAVNNERWVVRSAVIIKPNQIRVQLRDDRIATLQLVSTSKSK